MCLITKWKKPKVAEQDIVCYKVVLLTNDPNKFRAYWQDDFIFEIGKTHKHHFWNLVCKTKADISDLYEIYGGMFHSFQKRPTSRFNPVLEYIIPKGTKYYEGLHDEYCSRTIKIVKIL